MAFASLELSLLLGFAVISSTFLFVSGDVESNGFNFTLTVDNKQPHVFLHVKQQSTALANLSDVFKAYTANLTINSKTVNRSSILSIKFSLLPSAYVDWPSLISTLSQFTRINRLDFSNCFLSNVPSDLFNLDFSSVNITGNDLACTESNLGVHLLAKLGSVRLIHSGSLPVCDVTSLINSSFLLVPQTKSVYLYSDFSLPCTPLSFLFKDEGVWSESVVYWSSQSLKKRAVLSANDSLALCLPGVNNSDSYSQVCYRYSSATVQSKSLDFVYFRSQFNTRWTCTLVKNNVTLHFSHSFNLRTHMGVIEMTCALLAVGTAVVLIAGGFVGGFIRRMVYTRCCTRVPHLVEAQSVHKLNESPKLNRNVNSQIWTNIDDPEGFFDDDDSDAWIYQIRVCDSDIETGDLIDDDDRTSYISPLLMTREALVEKMRSLQHSIHLGHLKGRMRCQVQIARTRMATLGENSASAMRGVGSSMRAGLFNSMETVKWQMKSMAEFCGTSVPLNQTISVVSISTDLDSALVEKHVHCITNV